MVPSLIGGRSLLMHSIRLHFISVCTLSVLLLHFIRTDTLQPQQPMLDILIALLRNMTSLLLFHPVYLRRVLAS